MSEEIKGIEYPFKAPIDAHMFIDSGYVRQRIIAGRGRERKIVQVRYDKQYPADLINEILLQVSSMCESTEQYETWYEEFVAYPAKPVNADTGKLASIAQIIAKYKAESQQNPRWDKANKLITEFDSILGDSNE